MMARIGRRRLLRLSGAGAIAGSGGLVAILASDERLQLMPSS
jgi:hypothetical protein